MQPTLEGRHPMRPTGPRLERAVLAAGALMLAPLLAVMFLGVHLPSLRPWLGLDYYTVHAAGALLADGADPYDPVALDRWLHAAGLPRIEGDAPGCTPAWLTLTAASGTFLAPDTGWLLWGALAWTAHVATLALLASRIPGDGSGLARAAPFVLLASPAAIGTVFMGQSSTLVGLCLALVIVSRASRVQGLGIALATCAKVFPAGLLAWTWAVGRWRAASLAISGMIALHLAVAWWRPGVLRQFVEAMTSLGGMGPAHEALLANQSLLGVLTRWSSALGYPEGAGWVYPPLAVLLIAGSALAVRRGQGRIDELGAVNAIAGTAFGAAPYLWHHAYACLTPLYLAHMRTRPRLGYAAFALSCAQFALDGVASQGPFGSAVRLLGSPAFVSLVLLVLADLRGRRSP
jgi:hypothetical protein